MIGLVPMIGRLVLGGLVKVGVGEAVAGRITSGRGFPLVLAALAGVVLWFGVPWLIERHNDRIETAASLQATQACISAHAYAAEKARADWLEHGASVAAATIKARESDTALQAARADRLEAELKEARDAGKGRDFLAVPPGDPWLPEPRK